MSGYLVAAVGVLGLLVGSFLNVVIARVPAGESIVRPRSKCPRCGNAIRERDNIPVISWLLLRGRCRDCGNPISARYPAVELLTAAVFAVLAWAIGLNADLPAFLFLGAAGVALAAIDIDTKRLPSAIIYPTYVVGLVGLAAAALVDDAWDAYLRAVIGMVALRAFYFLLAMLKKGGMGGGDVRLAGVLGLYLAWLGWDVFAAGAALPFLLGGVIGLVLILFTKATGKSGIPFGPYMLVGVLVAILSGAWLVDWYIGLTGL